ncbi:MAG: DNA translocase FtsK [Candidatus Magasanikbacteria bacterium]
MAKNKSKFREFFDHIHEETKKSIWVVTFLGIAILLILAATGQAGPVGNSFYSFFHRLFGIGYYLLPIISFTLAFSFISPDKKRRASVTIGAVIFFILSGLGFIDIISKGTAGLTGSVVGSLSQPFGIPASLVITGLILIISFLLVLNRPLKPKKAWEAIKSTIPNWRPPKSSQSSLEVKDMTDSSNEDSSEKDDDQEDKQPETSKEENSTNESIKKEVVDKDKAKKEETKPSKENPEIKTKNGNSLTSNSSGNYEAPPLSLLNSNTKKPTIGDLKANANIIQRTLDSFGIDVEMGEVEVGPTVTRYTLKPAEGVKLSKITSLNQDLALALAAHPVRIEAPIPGRSVVGVEVPNDSAAMVRLGSLISMEEFQNSNPLTIALGRDVSGDPVFVDIAEMPHLLVAGATGSGKSIAIHSMLVSLLSKNSPEDLKLILTDPKRVELSAYEDIPHLVTDVITKNKKSLSALKWAIDEMERRYETLLDAGARDIKSFNKKDDQHMPYILIVMDELADLMSSHGKEVEGAIVRLAQMSRATGIHLVVSTQRPSVEVITGLIKANITTRIALQVASQVDSRTILDSGGAEKLLGSGDMLYESSESSKPRRIQGAYISEKEIKDVVNYIKENNETGEQEVELEKEEKSSSQVDLDEYQKKQEKDELYEDAVKIVKKADKGSASLLQRRLRIGYARAARILDQMHEEGIVGPARGSKARKVLVDTEEGGKNSKKQEDQQDSQEKNEIKESNPEEGGDKK